jgi:hypothetical protein
MKRLWQWLKAANENAKARAKVILAAKERMGCMDEVWRGEGEQSSDAVALLLMRIGLAHIEAVYQGQMMAQHEIRRGQAHLN